MPIKEKSVFTKREFEYESPDGDKYSLVYVEHEKREYVEISRIKEDGTLDAEQKTVWDVAMLREISDTIAGIKNKSTSNAQTHGLMMPNIIDHRGGRAELIERSVNASMRRFDNSVQPVESFDSNVEKASWEKVITGVDRDNEGSVSETPDELSIDGKDQSELTEWQRDALSRKLSRPQPSPEAKIKRVDAGDFI